MVRKRDGPRIAANDQGPEQGEVGPSSLPRAQTPRKPIQGHTSPSSHRRTRRRQRDDRWRGFAVRFYLRPGTDAHALYALLRAAAERYGLEVGDVQELSEPPQSDD